MKESLTQNKTKSLFSNLNFYMIIISILVYMVCIYSQRHFTTGDTHVFQIGWWNYISKNGFTSISTINNPLSAGGIGADYTSIWYFIIWIFCKVGLYPNFPIEYNIKLIAVLCSLASALSVYFIIKHFRPNSKYAPTFGMITTLFLPSFLLEVIRTNLPDTLYLMFVLFALLSFIKNKKSLAWLMLGFGICFKMMAIYLAPFFMYYYIKDFTKYNLREKVSPFFAFVSVFICSIPHVLSGGSWYNGIIGAMKTRSTAAMNISAYSLWHLMPNNADSFKMFSIALMTLAFAAIFIFVIYFVPENNKHKVEYTILLPLFPMIAYFLLPAQHEAYFSMAAVFAFIIWCISPSKKTFLVFSMTNILLFIGYCTISFRWHLDTLPNSNSILYDYQLFSLFTASIIFYLIYQIYRNSIYYKGKK